MNASQGWMVLIATGGVLVVVPAIAWIVWLRQRRWPSLLVAIVTSAPLASGLVGAIIGVALMRSWTEGPSVAPSEKARVLAEHISQTMNVTAFAAMGAAIIAGVVVVVSRATRRTGSN